MIYFIKKEEVLAFKSGDDLKLFMKDELEKIFMFDNPVFIKLEEASTKEHFNFIAKNFLNGVCGLRASFNKWCSGGACERE